MILPEESFYFQSNTRNLLATFHPPPGEARGGILVIHPFGEEKKCAHRTLVETARALARHGIGVMRFDLSGCGDSEGAFRAVRLAHWAEDIQTAWKALAQRVHSAPRGILGLRLGAALASGACAILQNVAALFLWQPVFNGKTEFTSELRRLLIQDMMLNHRPGGSLKEILHALERDEGELELDGYPVTAALYKDICAINLAEEAAAWPQAVTLTQFSRPTRAIASLAQKTGAKSTVVEIQPIWIRSDFMPTHETGELLATASVLPLLNIIGHKT